MKINASIIWDAIKCWLVNGKTMTSLIVGLVLAIAAANGYDLTETNIEMITTFMADYWPLLSGILAGALGKVFKTIKVVQPVE